LLRPVAQVGALAPHAQIRLELAQDVAKRGWRRHALRHREGRAVRLAFSVIGVLAQDHDARLGQGRRLQGGADALGRRIDFAAGTLALKEALEFLRARGAQESTEGRLVPARLCDLKHALKVGGRPLGVRAFAGRQGLPRHRHCPGLVELRQAGVIGILGCFAERRAAYQWRMPWRLAIATARGRLPCM